MAPPRHRGAFNSGFQLCLSCGILIAYLVNYNTEKIKGGWGWRVSLALAALPASVLTISTPFLPETPNSLVQQGNQEKAKRMLQKIRGTADVEAEFDDLIAANNASKTIKHPFKNIFQRKYRPQLVMSIAIPFFQQVTGINVIAFYSPMLFQTIGSGVSASLLSSVVTGIAGLSTVILSLLIVDKVGRRALFHIGGVLMFVPQMIIGGIMAAKLGDQEIRSAAQSITVATSFLFTFIVAQTFLTMLCHFKARIFFFFGAWVALMTGFVYVLLPETKDVPLETMDTIWREHWFWKRFVGDGAEYEGK
ncbi:UNVERIFIED_CONTAM: Hexose carrier protein HEX6 [Sesamum radiatum]|uniref:Hexose carrier protein HEX6 n=1 Tax=Sesamum radiatum TaxID=300843 RepID=A0AAW2JXG4_SESRA